MTRAAALANTLFQHAPAQELRPGAVDPAGAVIEPHGALDELHLEHHAREAQARHDGDGALVVVGIVPDRRDGLPAPVRRPKVVAVPGGEVVVTPDNDPYRVRGLLDLLAGVVAQLFRIQRKGGIERIARVPGIAAEHDVSPHKWGRRHGRAARIRGQRCHTAAETAIAELQELAVPAGRQRGLEPDRLGGRAHRRDRTVHEAILAARCARHGPSRAVL